MIRFVLMAIFWMVSVTSATATTYTLTDCTSGTINTQITAAADGDTIVLDCSGTVNWTTTISIPNTKGIKLRGPGTNPLPSFSTPANYTLTITSSASPMIYMNLGANKAVSEVSGLKFANYAGSDGIFIDGQGRGVSPFLGGYRIHNNIFNNFSSSDTIQTWCDDGECTGVSDHNSFIEGHTDNYTFRIRDVRDTSACFGLSGWSTPFTRGDNRYHFIENNYFYNATTYQRHQIAIDVGGARYVARYNTFNTTVTGSPDIMEAHGNESQGPGARGGEIYANTLLGSDASIGRWINLRGGQWLIYDNTFQAAASASPIMLTHYRASEIDYWQGNIESACGEEATRPLTDSPSFYPAQGQIQASYMWNNTISGVNQCPALSAENWISHYIQSGRDYFCGVNQEATGLSYTAYTYPHPLQGTPDITPPAVPTGLTVTLNKGIR